MNLLSKAEMKNVMGGLFDSENGNHTGCAGGQTTSESIISNTMNLTTTDPVTTDIMISIITSECNKNCSPERPV